MVLSLETRNATSTNVWRYGAISSNGPRRPIHMAIWAFYDYISNLFLKDGKSGMPVN
jgi:hypothetical protein